MPIKLEIKGFDAIPRFDFINKNNLYYKTYISQEFLKKKILAANSIYLCVNHNKDLINKNHERILNNYNNLKKLINNGVLIINSKFVETNIIEILTQIVNDNIEIINNLKEK